MAVTELTDTCHRIDLSPIWFVTDLTGTRGKHCLISGMHERI